MKIKSVLFFAAFVAFAADCFAVDGKFADCGPGFVKEDVKSIEGILTVKCKKLWCRDLENGRVMGKDGAANNGYEAKMMDGGYGAEYDEKGIGIECFGKRKWCAGQNPPRDGFDYDLGIWAKEKGNALYRGVLKGDCYYWQIQGHACDASKGEIAIHNGTSWACVSQADPTNPFGRSAIKARAVRRTSGVVNMKLRAKSALGAKPKAKAEQTEQ